LRNGFRSGGASVGCDRAPARAGEIAEAEGIGKSYVSRILRLALLAPDVVEEILEGRARDALMLKKLERRLPASWVEQRSLLLALAGRGVRPATS
jgi:hypothetical protein